VSADLAILVPVLGRPHRVAPLLETIEATTPGRPSVLFLADSGDDAEIAAIERAEDNHLGVLVLLNLEGGNYAEKINRGVEVTCETFVFCGADDLGFKPGWFEAAKAAMTDDVEVVGVNDLLRRRPRRRGHATHFLMTRAYAERATIDDGRGPLHEGYGHNFVDDELIATATSRGAYAYAPNAHVEHLHWMNRRAEMDETYRRGRELFDADRIRFQERESLWA
jgi:glycosyltransferase involved in cell wall biosynthesis